MTKYANNLFTRFLSDIKNGSTNLDVLTDEYNFIGFEFTDILNGSVYTINNRTVSKKDSWSVNMRSLKCIEDFYSELKEWIKIVSNEDFSNLKNY